MLKLFNRPKRNRAATRELAPQWTSAQRQYLELASLPPADLAYATYDRMETDPMIQTALTVKRLGVLASAYRIVPSDGSDLAKRNAEFVESQFRQMRGSPETILMGAMDAFAKGWSAQELIWETDSRNLQLAEVKPKDPAMFGLDLDEFGTVRGLKLQIPGESPRDLPRGKFALYFNRPRYARSKGRSDLDAAYSHWQSKTALLNAWKQHMERFAAPTVLGKHDAGVSEESRSSMLTTLERLQDKTAIVYSDEFDIGTLGGNKEASTGFMEAIEFHNREMARSILGQTLTTDEGRRVGSLALGKVHLQVLLLQLEGIRKELADVLMTEQIIRPMIELNFGPGGLPRFEFEPVTLGAFASGQLE